MLLSLNLLIGLRASQGDLFAGMRGYIPLGGLDKTLVQVVNDVLYIEVSNPLFDRKSKENDSFSC